MFSLITQIIDYVIQLQPFSYKMRSTKTDLLIFAYFVIGMPTDTVRSAFTATDLIACLN